MNLIGIEVKTPDGTIVLDEESDVADWPGRDRHRKEVPHLAGIPSIAWSLELDLAQYPVPGIFFSSIQREPGLQQNVIIANCATTAKVKVEDREGNEGLRLRYMLVTQLCEPVIGRYEEIVPADVIPVVKRRLDSFEIVNGAMLKSSEYETGNVPVIAGGQTPAGFHSNANRPANTITISGSGAYAGFVSFHTVPIFASDCSTIDNPKDADIIYLYFCLLSKQKEIYKCQAGGAQPHVHAKDIKDITIMMPPSVEEQKAISVVLTKSEDEIKGLECQRNKYVLIKQGMMQELLTGKTRL